ncbi:NADH-quinone oxidoreductase subunit C [Alicyclobacillus sp. SO9]|uniref:NADH-quinone oxidoreductase subunit C n=1 Tax=Alicyclobacillus sp. SO9 TaxID=2665646 RepID=UPI0018E8E36B|nr:NADH-quinone oxidoreductase subunit C [Alicyclobacillus sp. SO9]QQE78772.1 NADH-quinone oxidoreductase subunit C [Alicyclobacillus sp. SO9]
MSDEEKREQSANEQSASEQSANEQGSSDESVTKASAAKTDKDTDTAKSEPAQPKQTETADAKVQKQESVGADADGEKKPATPKKPAAAAKPAGKAAAAKKKAEPKPPDPREVAAKETAEQIKKDLVSQFGEDVVEETGAAKFKPMLVINKTYWLKAVDYLRTADNWLLNYVECMAGTDYPDFLETVIFVQSTEMGHFICLKTRTDKETAEVPSLVSAHPGVNWEEREIYDLVGVKFTGHPDLRRIMMWDEFEGHPLRKDYDEWG